MRTPNKRLHVDDAELIAKIEDWNSRGFPSKIITQAALRKFLLDCDDSQSKSKEIVMYMLTEMGRKSQQEKK